MKIRTYMDEFILSESLDISTHNQDLFVLVDYLIEYYSKKKLMGTMHQMSKCINLLRYIVENHADVLEQKQLFDIGESYIRDAFTTRYLSKSQCILCF